MSNDPSSGVERDAEWAELLALDDVPSLCNNSECEGCGEAKTYRGQEASSRVCCRVCWRMLPRWMTEAFTTSNERPNNRGATIWENRIAVTLRWMREGRGGEMRVNEMLTHGPNKKNV